MPGTQPTTLGNNGSVPPVVNALAQALAQAGGAASANGLQTSSQILDQYENTPLIIGQLNQTVTIGAGFISESPVYGVEVGTGLSGVGIAYASAFAHSLITLTKGSTSATLTGGTTGFVNGMQIGATTYEVPPALDVAAPPNYIQPGTTMTISGTAVTLSQNALLSGTGLYVAAVTWVKLNVDVHP